MHNNNLIPNQVENKFWTDSKTVAKKLGHYTLSLSYPHKKHTKIKKTNQKKTQMHANNREKCNCCRCACGTLHHNAFALLPAFAAICVFF